ncbi:MAG: 16S rRNA (guanine(527)-N(7))-methyltransferase RsmG [Calditrichota bacterium]
MIDLKEIVSQITDSQIVALQQYVDLVTEWNQNINLVSRKDVEFFQENHILPSIVVLATVPLPEKQRIADIGSGGGLPAIPMAIMKPQYEIVMLESILKKCSFLQHAIEALNLKNASVIRTRAEEVDGTLLGSFDMVTARAVASIDKLIKWGKPLLKQQDSSWLLWKGESDEDDLLKSVRKKGYPFEIYDIPTELKPLSPKFAAMRFFQIDML